MTINELRKLIAQSIPQDRLVLKPGENHIYNDTVTGADYASVTTKNSILAKNNLKDYRMNQAIDYIRNHINNNNVIDKDNLENILAEAKAEHERKLADASNIGTITHDILDKYCKQWIMEDKKPDSILSFVTDKDDYRVWSGLRSAETWINESGYVPVATELKVWSEELRSAGTLDNIGMIGDDVVIADWKTSNQLCDEYWLQVPPYAYMFTELTGIIPNRMIIVRLDKDHGIPDTEEIPIDTLYDRIKDVKAINRLYDSLEEISRMRKIKSNKNILKL